MTICGGSEKIKEKNLLRFPHFFHGFVIINIVTNYTLFKLQGTKNLLPNFMLGISSTFSSAVYNNIALCKLGFQAFFSNILATILWIDLCYGTNRKSFEVSTGHFCGYKKLLNLKNKIYYKNRFFALQHFCTWKQRYLKIPKTISMRLNRIKWYGGTLLFISLKHR